MPDGIRRRPTTEPDDSLLGIHPVLARVFASRKVSSLEQLSYKLEKLLPPAGFAGLPEAAQLLADTLQSQKRILIVGDFDADGATSTALAVSTLRALGARQVDYLVPNRFEFGYGLTPGIVELASQSNPDLIVTVDNGISSIDGVEKARSLGIATLVTDHHLPGKVLPEAEVIVNPNQAGCDFPSGNLAGVGVIFYVMLALRSELRSRNWFSDQGIDEPNIADALDLVALGTVADVVPLDYNNRILVQQGLMRIRSGKTRPGIAALLEIASRNATRLVAGDLAFAIGPRLNAAGRLDDMSVGIACLLSQSQEQARDLAQQLDALNRDRQQIEKGMQAQALEIVQQCVIEEKPPALCLYEPDWHQGVVGIVASRIKDRIHRPVIAFAAADNGQVKGSARSIPGLHIRDALERVSTLRPKLIDKFGGHAMAAGLSLDEENLDEFQSLFSQVVADNLAGVELESIVETDGELDIADLNLGLAKALRYASPWGQHFPEPVFDGEFQVVHQRLVGERHLKLVLAHPQNSQQIIDAIAFNVDLQVWPDETVERVSIGYRLDCNYYRGEESLQLMVEYLSALK